MATHQKDSWDKFMAGHRTLEEKGGDLRLFEETRMSAIEVMAYRPSGKGFPSYTPGNLSVPAKWLALNAPDDAVAATRGLVAGNSMLASFSVRDVVGILGARALPVLEEMNGKVVDYRCLIAAAEGALSTEAKSPELMEAVDQIIGRLVEGVIPRFAPSIVRLLALRGGEFMRETARMWEDGASPYLAFYAAALLEGDRTGGDEGAQAAGRSFDYGLPLAAVLAMKWKPEWEPLRQLIDREGVPCVRIRSHAEREAGTSTESFFGGAPVFRSAEEWPVKDDGKKMVFFARIGRDVFTAGGFPSLEARDLWIDAEGDQPSDYLYGCWGKAKVTLASGEVGEAEGDGSASPFPQVFLSFVRCLDLPQKEFDDELPEELREEWESFLGMAWGLEGNYMNQAFSRDSEKGFSLLFVSDYHNIHLSFPVRFSMDATALEAGDFSDVDVSPVV